MQIPNESELQAAQSVSALIHTIYHGLAEATPWSSFLSQLREWLSADVVAIVLRFPSDRDRGAIYASGSDNERFTQYRNELYRFSVFAERAFRQVTTLADIVPEEQWHTLDLYRHCLQPMDLYHIMAIDTAESFGVQARLFAGRARARGAFAQLQKHWLALVSMHLGQALQFGRMQQESEFEHALYAGAFERLQVASILLDEDGRILRENAIAQSLLDAGGVFVRQQHRLTMIAEESQSLFRQAVAQLTQWSRFHSDEMSQAIVIGNYHLLIKTVAQNPARRNQWLGQNLPALAVMIVDAARSPVPAKPMLRQLFGLTEAEATLSLLLVQGLSIDECAQAQGVTRNTVNTHVKSLFLKCGVSRQASLVRLLSTSIAVLA